MNPGGIRAHLNETAAPNTAADVTYGEAFTVQPFGNSLVTMDLTGAQIDTLLEQQWCAQAPGTARILSVSAGFTYTWDGAVPQATCEKVSNIAIGGTPLNPGATYSGTVNSFLAGGGDGFSVLRDGTNRAGGDLDLDAFEAHFAGTTQAAPLPQPDTNRITRVN